MSVREKMKQWREQRGIDIRMAARGCRISARLLSMLEEGEVTAPGIVERVAKYYGLTDLEAEELLPLCRRPHGGDYEPDRYEDRTDVLLRVSDKGDIMQKIQDHFSRMNLSEIPEGKKVRFVASVHRKHKEEF